MFSRSLSLQPLDSIHSWTKGTLPYPFPLTLLYPTPFHLPLPYPFLLTPTLPYLTPTHPTLPFACPYPTPCSCPYPYPYPTLPFAHNRASLSRAMLSCDSSHCICKNKSADQLHGNSADDQCLCFCYTDSTDSFNLSTS